MIPQLFTYEGQQVRTATRDGQPWFAGKDVCEILDLGNTAQALSRLEDDEIDGIIFK